MKRLDISLSCNCPYCNQDIYRHIHDNNNIIEESERYEKYDITFGFEYYRDYYYQCPKCGEKFYTARRPKDLR